MNILIGDDHSVVRRGIINIVQESFKHAKIVEAVDGFDMVKKLDQENWHIIISDISMPGRTGLDIVKIIKEQYPKIPVLIMSVHSAEHYAVRMLKAGASGYLTKDTAPDELVKAINQLLSGRKYITPEVADLLIEFQHDVITDEPHKNLSDREFEVFQLIAKGKKITEIADELFLSINTISTYRTRILEKMHMASNAEITKYAINNGLA